MTKYHISKDGKVRICRAKQGNCPLGGEEQHFSSQREAQDYANQTNESEFGLLGNKEALISKQNLKKDLEKELSEKELKIMLAHSEINLKKQYIAKTMEDTKDLSRYDKVFKAERELEKLEEQLHEAIENSSKPRARLQKMLTQELITEKQNQGIIFDTDVYVYDNDQHRIVDELENILEEHTNKPKGEVITYALLAKKENSGENNQGAIHYHETEGYMKTRSDRLSVAIIAMFNESDRIKLRNNQGILELVANRQDGVDVCEIKPITKSKFEEYNKKTNHSNIGEVVSFLKTIPSITLKKSSS